MTLGNFHANGNIGDIELLKRSDGFIQKFIASFRQAAANGNFNFGIIKLQDSDLNRIHSIVNEIDQRRLFYNCSDDEMPKFAMQSLYEVRKFIREESRRVWAAPSCEAIVQEISHALSEACTTAERLGGDSIEMGGHNYDEFLDVITDMRLKAWSLVAILKEKVGSVVTPRNMPAEIEAQVQLTEL
ncbi:hypothetical protein [Idiomarina sp.]|uniref:hypothetical protein n=1 Tax=Idiomarina sp. TaxID=1874361 RepID=UPI0025BC0A1B|nr:hypothetical protein [Idiomarina sp.]